MKPAPALESLALPPAFDALPVTIARGPHGDAALVIMPSAFSPGPDVEAKMLDLAHEARLCVTYDPFFRTDPGVVPYADFGRVRARIGALDRPALWRDVQMMIAWARTQPGVERVVMLGVCFGGPFALLAAADGLVDGIVTWHGSRMEAFLDRAVEIGCPVRFHFGAVDPFVPPAAVEAVKAAFAAHPDAEIVVHAGATHGFSHADAPQAHDPAAELAGMKAVRDLLHPAPIGA
ncbi:MAG: dienelactone hydrolase family protein [Myxococcales bacterium]|nr:dienelactone hydrolase family protein [Myxococcales bacterium]